MDPSSKARPSHPSTAWNHQVQSYMEHSSRAQPSMESGRVILSRAQQKRPVWNASMELLSVYSNGTQEQRPAQHVIVKYTLKGGPAAKPSPAQRPAQPGILKWVLCLSRCSCQLCVCHLGVPVYFTIWSNILHQQLGEYFGQGPKLMLSTLFESLLSLFLTTVCCFKICRRTK